MNDDSVALVKRSFEQLAPIEPQAAGLFYRNLFQLDPSLERMFRGDMVQQGEKLMKMLATAVALLGDSARPLPALEKLGTRHVGYGVQEGHYATVGAALIMTLEQGLGAAFNAKVRMAWTECYALIARTMINASAAVSAAA